VPKVLVIDDSLSVRHTIERMLAPRGMQVASCASGYEAVARLRAEAPDLLICDLVLPDVDGLQVCRWLRQLPEHAATPVLLIGSIVDAEIEQEAARLGAAGVLRKPLAGDELARTAERVLAARRQTAPAAEPGAEGTEGAAAGRRAGRQTTGILVVAPASSRTRELMIDLATLEGFRCALLLSPAGQVLTVIGDLTTAAASLAAGPLAQLLAAAATASTHLGLAEPAALLLETEGGTLLAQRIDERAILVVVLTGSASLGKARFQLGRLRTALQQTWDAAPG
jgi:twitching motility two-component system response regulator PilH